MYFRISKLQKDLLHQNIMKDLPLDWCFNLIWTLWSLNHWFLDIPEQDIFYPFLFLTSFLKIFFWTVKLRLLGNMDHCSCCYIFFLCSNNFLSCASASVCNVYSSVVLCPKLLMVQWDFYFSHTWFDVVKILLSYWSSAYHIAHYKSHPSAFNSPLSLSLQILIYAYRFFSNFISSNYVLLSFSCLIFDTSSQWSLSLLATWCITSM